MRCDRQTHVGITPRIEQLQARDPTGAGNSDLRFSCHDDSFPPIKILHDLDQVQTRVVFDQLATLIHDDRAGFENQVSTWQQMSRRLGNQPGRHFRFHIHLKTKRSLARSP